MRTINKDLKRLGLIPRTKAFESQLTFAKYLYVFCTGLILGALFT